MMHAKKYKMARVAAIVAINPFTSCCFLVSIPMGIWAMVLLGKPVIKASSPAMRRIETVSRRSHLKVGSAKETGSTC
jgi:hypothetical protein